MDPIYKLLDSNTQVDEKTRTVEVICSTATPDRIGDVIVQEGIDVSAYRKNPVVLWGHDADKPVARAPDIFLQNGQLRAVTQFPPEGEDPDADWVYGKIKNRLVNAVSIGFLPKEWEPVDPKSPWDGYKFVASELVEFSFVSVPMNAEALIVGRSLKPPKQMRGMVLPSLRAAGDPNWQCGATKDLPTHPADDFDGDEATKRLETHCGIGTDNPDHAQMCKGFAAHDANAPGEKGSYKFPFADVVDGKMCAHKGGCAAMKKACGSSDLPQHVKDAAVAVANHYESLMDDDGDESKALDAALGLVVDKAGRVLSSANEERLRAAHSAIGTVLDQLTTDTGGGEQQQAQGVRPRQADVEGRSQATLYPRRAAREIGLLKMRSA